jgi:hypothetical protein
MRRLLIGPIVGLALILAVAAPALGIVYGQVDTDSDGVDVDNVGGVVVEFEGERFPLCSGTLIAPTVFLTAAHCVEDGATMIVSFDATIADPLTTLYEGTAHAHPDAFSGGRDNTFDLAVIVFDEPVVGITPADLPTENLLSNLSNQELKRSLFLTAGYGAVRDTRQGASQGISFNNQRRWAWQHVDSLTPAWLTLSKNPAADEGGTCFGDSGGPHFLETTVVAVSIIGDRFCKAIDQTYRLDTTWSRDFLSDFVALP